MRLQLCLGNNVQMKKVYIKTYGCQMNVHDSEKMAGALMAEGYEITAERDEADVVIFNTCSIRDKAEHKFLSDLGRLKKAKTARPGLKIAVAGCIAQHRGASLKKSAPHIDLIIGPQSIHGMADMLTNQGQGVALEARADVEKLEMPAVRPAGPRAWVNIMYGCNNFCTYCIVPYTRGRETSRRSANIINEIRELSRSGYREITLLGQNVNSYSDEVDFPGLLGMIHDLDGIERIRFTTNHPRDLGPELIEAMATLPKVCHHIHLPLQSGSDRILKAMNRKYTLEEYSAKVEALRAAIPDIAITTDIITGFPGELDEDHEATMGALRRLRYDGLFGFRYSPREGTRAAEMLDQVPEALKQARLQEVLDLQEEFTSAINESLVGRELEVLVDGASENDKHRLSGRTPGNKIVSFEGELSLTGSLVNVRIERAGRHSLYGVIIG